LLCPFDNGRNDDDRDRRLHGHVEKINGLDMWVPAFGGAPKLNMHPCAQGGAIRLAKKMVERENA
ncbi:MAG: HNH endonuclease, partial [Corynebacterium glucuronolyticum]|nr:HNH endonuclease [Corynebacterium glucuronolyticum]